MKVIDSMAWGVVRLIGIAQVLIGQVISMFYHPNPCESDEYDDFNKLHSMIFGGWMMFESKSPDDFPAFMSTKLLLFGRVILAMILISIITEIAREILL